LKGTKTLVTAMLQYFYKKISKIHQVSYNPYFLNNLNANFNQYFKIDYETIAVSSKSSSSLVSCSMSTTLSTASFWQNTYK
jgi:hypothetical protein